MTDFTGGQFWHGRHERDVYDTVGRMWIDAWTHADGTTCDECVWNEKEIPMDLSKVCAILLMVRVEEARKP